MRSTGCRSDRNGGATVSHDAVEIARALRERIAARLKELEAEKRLLQRQLDEANQFLDSAERYAGLGPDEMPELADQSPRKHAQVGNRIHNPRRSEVLDVVARAISVAGRPMKLRDIQEVIRAEGIDLTGTNPTSVLGTMLWRGTQDGSLVNLKGLGYWPARLPYPPANYAGLSG